MIAPDSAAPHERGMALLVVLWTLSLLALLIVAFAQGAWLERHRVRNLIDASVAKSALHAGLSFGIAALLHSRSGGGWARDGTPYNLKFADSDLTISLQDANGCLNINTASLEDIRALLGTIGVETGVARSLAAAIVDWRDPDNLQTPNGAETSAYINAGTIERPGNRPFLSTGELNSVLGMTPAIFDRFLPLVSIFPVGPEINRSTAPEHVLRADASIPIEETVAILARRADRVTASAFDNAAELGSLSFDAQPRTATQADLAESAEGPVFSVSIDVVTLAGARARGHAEIWLTQDPLQPYRILDWRLVRSPLSSSSMAP